MCSIFGILKFDNQPQVEYEIIINMLSSISHREPDEQYY